MDRQIEAHAFLEGSQPHVPPKAPARVLGMNDGAEALVLAGRLVAWRETIGDALLLALVHRSIDFEFFLVDPMNQQSCSTIIGLDWIDDWIDDWIGLDC